MAEFLINAERFVLSHGSIIQKAPLQLYASALVFSPKKSMIRTLFWEKRLPFIKRAQGSTPQWRRLRQTLEGHTDRVGSLAFSPSNQDSPDSMTLASASADGTVRLWDAVIGKEKLKFGSDESAPSSSGKAETRHCFVAFSPDGKALASSMGSSGNDIKVFDIAGGRVKNILKLPDASSVVQSVMFSADQKKLFAISSRLARGGNQWKQRHERTTAPNRARPRSSRWADRAGEDDKLRSELRVWNLDEDTSHRIGSYGTPTALSLDATLLASVEGGTDIKLWSADTGDLRCALGEHETAITDLVFCRNSNCNLLVSFSPTVKLRIWDADAGVMKYLFEKHASGAKSTVMAIWPRDNLIAFQTMLEIVVYDYVDQIQKHTYRNQLSEKDSMLYSPDGMTLAAGVKTMEGKHHIELWATENGPYDETPESLWPTESLTFSPDGGMIASNRRTAIMLWDASTATSKHSFGFVGKVLGLGFSPDGVILAARFDKEIKGLLFWNTVTGDHKEIVIDGDKGNSDFVFSPDGRILATTWNTGHTVQLWDCRNGHHMKTFELSDTIRELSFSADGSVLHTSERDLAISQSTPQSESKTEIYDGLSEYSGSRAFRFNGEWIVYETKPLVWIPLQYRGSGKAAFGNRVALESTVKELIVIELDPEHAC